MRRFLGTALIAAAIFGAGSAQAASFITYKIFGTASFQIFDRNSSGLTQASGTYQATYVVPIGVTGLTGPATVEGGQYVGSSYLYAGFGFGRGVSTASAVGNNLTFTETAYLDFTNYVLASSSFNICLTSSTNNAFPTSGSLAVDPSCSRSAFYYPRFFQTITGVLGTVSAVTASISDVNPGSYGFTDLQIANLVPEPSTWALMLAGFAMTGYALRRRRASVAFA
jgi:hypothetical protein